MTAMRLLLAVATLLLPLSGSSPSSVPESTLDRGHADAATSRPPSKLLVFVVENHSLRQMRSEMPFTRRLASRYGYATRYRAVTHPSLPNYLAITTGSTHGIRDDKPPSAHPVSGTSVFGQALENGKTARLYAERMVNPCATVDRGRYAVRHNPWTYQLDERASCRRHDVPVGQLAGDVAEGRLPNAGMVIPDLCHDAHDCALRSADRWLRRQVSMVMSGKDWTSGRLVVVITADEDAHNQDNRVLTVVAHPGIRGVVVDRALSHYSLSRSFSQMIGAAPLGHARAAASLTRAFDVTFSRTSAPACAAPEFRYQPQQAQPPGRRRVRREPSRSLIPRRVTVRSGSSVHRRDRLLRQRVPPQPKFIQMDTVSGERRCDGRDASPGRGLRPIGA